MKIGISHQPIVQVFFGPSTVSMVFLAVALLR